MKETKTKFKFNKLRFKKNAKYVIVLIIVLFTVVLFPSSLSMYYSKGKSKAKVDIAFSLLNTENLSDTVRLNEILPNNQKSTYSFSVMNFDDDHNKIDVNLKYTITVRTTTNLHVKYELLDEDNNLIATTNSYTTDEDGSIWYTMVKTGNIMTFDAEKTDVYKISYSLSDIYKNSDYQDISELLLIDIDVEQIV